MGRSWIEQSDHDREVLRIAENYKANGYNVWADVASWTKKPVKVNGKIPDVITTKEFQQRTREGNIFTATKKDIVEVETAGSKNDPHAKEQAEAFKKAEREEQNTKFILRIIGE